MTLQTVELQLDFNEASDLLPLDDPALLRAEGADAAYLVSLDEGCVEGNLRLLTHADGAGVGDGWSVRAIEADAGDDADKTDDPEASAMFKGYAYVIGSHYGKKRGPLNPKRAWMARFDVRELREDKPVALHIVRDKLRLNRVINDALQASDIDLVELVPEYEAAFVKAARDVAEAKGKKWGRRVLDGDYPLNIEGAAFRANGNLLLGLRFPVTASGSPVLVEVSGVPDMFENGTWPEVVAVWWLPDPGDPDRKVGFRAITAMGRGRFDAIIGNLDAIDKDSALHDHYAGGRHATSEHWTFKLPSGRRGGEIKATLLERFESETRVEGLSPGPDGHMTYVVDEDHRVAMHFLRVE